MNQKKNTILIIEDEAPIRKLLTITLEGSGFKVVDCDNGQEGARLAASVRPDLILLDAMMPKVSGFDVLDILRNTPDTANLKIIMLTALSQESDKERANSLGVDDYLVKSQVVIADVIDRVKHHLGV